MPPGLVPSRTCGRSAPVSARAEQADTTAAHNVAVFDSQGSGIDKDPSQAVKWFETAADAGVTAAQVALGRVYAAGDGVERDRRLAADWFGKAVAKGDQEAKIALAMLHLHGDEAVRDSARAEELLRQAAKDGQADAALQLGHFYRGKPFSGAAADAESIRLPGMSVRRRPETLRRSSRSVRCIFLGRKLSVILMQRSCGSRKQL